MLTSVSSTHLDELIKINNKAYVVFNGQIHQYNVRTKTDLYIHRCNTTFGKRDVRFRADCLWNNLPLSLKKITSERINNLKIFLSERL